MAKPIASFAFIPDGLSVKFSDRSSGIPVSWSWDFGDGSIAVSTLQNPEVTYPLPGIFKVKLVASNADGASDPFIFYLVVAVAPSLNMTIEEMVAYGLPSALPFDPIGFQQARMKWQLWLQPAVDIDDDDVFDETKWPSLYNVLISKFIVYDLILKAANEAIIIITSSSTTAISGSTHGTSKGPLKSLETGPSKASWYDSSTLWSSIFRSAAQGGGIFSQLLADICLYSRRVGVKVPFCGLGPKMVRPFIVARGRCSQAIHDANFVNPPVFPLGLPPWWTDQQW